MLDYRHICVGKYAVNTRLGLITLSLTELLVIGKEHSESGGN
jgi:hypothetical protein